jgi:hypothetical protein
VDIEVVEVAAEVAIEVCMEVEIEPIRVDTKLDIVDTEAGLGTKSGIHNLAFCVAAGQQGRTTSRRLL